MERQLFEHEEPGLGKRPFIFAGLFLLVFVRAFLWDDFVALTDQYPLLRMLVAAEWAISRYAGGTAFLGLSLKGFFWFMMGATVSAWLFWTTVFLYVSPRVARKKKVRSIFTYFTVENHHKGFLAGALTSFVLWGQKHRRIGRAVIWACYFGFSFVSHGDIVTIAVAAGFRDRWGIAWSLAGMTSKIVFWSWRHLGYPI